MLYTAGELRGNVIGLGEALIVSVFLKHCVDNNMSTDSLLERWPAPLQIY